MSDTCCGPQEGEPQARPEKLWQVRELQLAAASVVLLVIGWLLSRAGHESWSLAVELIAVVVAAGTFVPDALRNLRHGRVGVGTLMTIAAVGAVALGQIA